LRLVLSMFDCSSKVPLLLEYFLNNYLRSSIES
jgi:hypothetical protein